MDDNWRDLEISLLYISCLLCVYARYFDTAGMRSFLGICNNSCIFLLMG